MKMICPHCKAEFYVTRGLIKEYVYKIIKPKSKLMAIYFCSYNCWRAEGGGH